jgi:predicted Fe-S protein YdhL (DUF1289 family)
MTVNQFAMKKLADYAVLAGAAAENVPSPCISVCRMDTRTGVCEGCLRTIDEIRLWSVNSDSEKRAVWALIAQRIVTATATFAAP